MPRSRSQPVAKANRTSYRQGLITGDSEHLKRYKILKRHEKRQKDHLNSTMDRNDSSNSDHSLEGDPDAEIEKVVNLVRKFSNDLYLPLREKHPINIAYSPLGFCISVTMIKLGCKGICHEELTKTLFPKPNGEIESAMESSEIVVGLSALLRDIKERPKSYRFNHAYKIFMDENHKAKAEFMKQMRGINAKGDLEEVDFSKDSWNTTAEKINQWANSTCSKQLGDILTKRTANSKIVFLNPIYFNGNFIHPFNPINTQNMKFTINDKECIDVPMMKSVLLKNLLYVPLNKLNCRALVLPYKGHRLGLVIFLPNEKNGLPVIETELESLSPNQYLRQMHIFRTKLSSAAGFQVYLPIFRIDSTLDLQIPMKELGIEALFTVGKADFSGLASNAPKEICVTQFLQNVVFDVTEGGTSNLANVPRKVEADDADSSYPKNCSSYAPGKLFDSGDSETIEFAVNHPFYFHVIDMQSDLIILAGACRNPLKGNELGFQQFLQKYDINIGGRSTL